MSDCVRWLAAPPAVSADGRYVLFGKRYREVLLRDRWHKTTETITVTVDGAPANDISLNEDLSGDGRFATFNSEASNLVHDLARH